MWPVRIVMMDEGSDGAFEMRLVQAPQPVAARGSCTRTALSPTNNAAERVLRTAVQWRKIMFGTPRSTASAQWNVC
jgi:hypothetical protein